MREYEDGYSVIHMNNMEGNKLVRKLTTKVDTKSRHSGPVNSKESTDVTVLDISYKDMFDKEQYKKAYDQLKSKPGNRTPGVDKETIDGISNDWIDKTIKSLKDRSFKFKPSKRVYIPKPGKATKRPIGIPSPRDKIIQKVICNILEKEYEEKIFIDRSHGFRPGRSCHTALREVRKWVGITWVIEGDIKGFFDNIDHHKLASILSTNIRDKNIIDLYWKLVNAGYVEKEVTHTPEVGVPQGGIISPLLSNIYLTVLDRYIEKLKLEYNEEVISIPTKEYLIAAEHYRKSKVKYSRDKSLENKEALIKSRKSMMKIPSVERIGTKIYYVRYADDWIIGIIGSIDTAREIKGKISKFLKEELLIELNEEKTKITNIKKNYIKFLGFRILATTAKYYEGKQRANRTNTGIQRNAHGKLKLFIPHTDLTKRLESKGFVKNNRGVYFGPWINYHDHEIIANYRAIIIGYVNYYYFLAANKSRLSHIVYLLQYSALHTLAAKYKISIAKAIDKYTKAVQVANPNGRLVNLIYKPKVIPSRYNPDVDPLTITQYSMRSHFPLCIR